MTEDGIGSHLFYFNPPRDVELTRDDGMIEQSINWADDDSVVDLALNQRRRDGDLQFKAGVVILSRSAMDRLNKLPLIGGLLGYERSPLDSNLYHGNLLLPEEVPKARMQRIAAGLALTMSGMITQSREHKTF